MSSYGKMIAKFRKEKGMTQVQLSELLFVSAQAISKWENDLSEPDLKTMQRLSEIFDKPVSVFFGQEEIKVEKEGIPVASVAKAPDHSFLCATCNTHKDERDIYIKYPNIICKACNVKEEQIKLDAKRQASLQVSKTNLKKSYIKYGVITSIISLIIIIIGITDKETSNLSAIFGGLVFGIVIFALSVDFKNLGPATSVYLFFRRGIRLPGVIFSLSIDGIIFLILVKVLFGILTLLISALFFVIAITLAAFVSIFTFIPLIIKSSRNPATIF